MPGTFFIILDFFSRSKVHIVTYKRIKRPATRDEKKTQEEGEEEGLGEA